MQDANQANTSCTTCGCLTQGSFSLDGVVAPGSTSPNRTSGYVWTQTPHPSGLICEDCLGSAISNGSLALFEKDGLPICRPSRVAAEAAFVLGARRAAKFVVAARLLASGNAEAALCELPPTWRNRVSGRGATAETFAALPFEAMLLGGNDGAPDPERAGMAATLSSAAVTGRPINSKELAVAARRFADMITHNITTTLKAA